ncbi:BLOC-1-related complex subunit 8 isoform X2 [Zalophus californianus]|uniref:BLOC-1-related complex subunit 8 isoform X2 n=1 Tax=Zalophus californianus TaxID=9704 RepID=A0A6J2CA28_ZALCA|nr:BLOC-1-related complex subunit 8 isoform X2 [Zalophus californianus]
MGHDLIPFDGQSWLKAIQGSKLPGIFRSSNWWDPLKKNLRFIPWDKRNVKGSKWTEAVSTTVTDKFTESVYVLANEPSVALYRLQEHVRRSLPELAQHKADMQRWEEQSQGAIYTVEYACSAVKNLVDSSVYFRSVEGLLKQAISIRDHMNAAAQGHR